MSIKKKGVTYARVSSNKKDQKKSIANQINNHSKYMDKYSLVSADDCGMLYYKGKITPMQGIYADEAESGTKTQKRKAFNQMISDAKAGKFDMIVVKDIARFARNTANMLDTLTDLKVLGIGVIFDTGGLNSLKEGDKTAIGFLAMVAEQESRSKSQAVKFGLRKAQENGIRTTGNAPFGYDLSEGGVLKVNADEAEIVRRVFNLYYYESYGYNRIARMFNKEGIPTKKKKDWTAEQISKILRRQLYNGLQIQHTVESIDINREQKRIVPEDERVIVDVPHLRIIDNELFELVQLELAKRADIWGRVDLKETKTVNADGEVEVKKQRILNRGQGRNSNKHLLSNLLRCGRCGGTMFRSKRRHHEDYEWICRNYVAKGSQTCSPRNARREIEILEQVKQDLTERKSKPDYFENIFAHHVYGKFNFEGADERIRQLESQIAELKAERMSINRRNAQGKLTDEEADEMMDVLRLELKQAEEELRTCTSLEEQLNRERRKFENFQLLLNSTDVDDISNGRLKLLLEKIVIGKDEEGQYIHPSWSFMGNDELSVFEVMAERDLRNEGDYLGDIDFDNMTDEEFAKWDEQYQQGNLWNGKPVGHGAS